MITTKRDEVFITGDGREVFVCDKVRFLLLWTRGTLLSKHALTEYSSQACRTAEIIKWSIFLGLMGIIFIYFTVGYWHARRRIRKGLQPLRYHRWLAPKPFRQQNNAAYYNPQNGTYGMYPYPEPPPVYNPNGMPPMYAPPLGGSKVAPQQNGVVPAAAPQTTPQQPPPAL
ncbi:uncharacterized protein PV09_07492 [Verruconis gallopava]|uniref:Uncharacterized protein n=1 Tax=Verruconis gallopava TaxID=253628 RepID=A0A0D2A3I8_9PEZI|nr:uncharacterized protein PV09_07492 [Verruconis gallopava]KIW00970.1 hypothetical protein PV09_07492 [Verruconis gallopava]